MISVCPIDLRIGEARSLCQLTSQLYELTLPTLPMLSENWEYQSTGYEPLVKFLEDKHSAPIIITNGANQALHAAMYALKTKNFKNLGFRIPYWNRIPGLADQVGIKCTPFEGKIFPAKNLGIDSYLMVLPNNPDGFLTSLDNIRTATEMLQDNNIPLIHDGAYYTRSFLPIDHPIENIGDMQIFSASKTYGLSSLRLGYIAVHNTDYYDPLLDFIETQTVGVSVLAQKLFLQLLERETKVPLIKETFIRISREIIKEAKDTFKQINSDLIEIPENFHHNYGAFAWVKPKIKSLFEETNIQVLPGSLFGNSDYVRINLVAGNDLIKEAVKRINGYKVQ